MNKLHLYSEPWDGDPSKDRNTFIGGSDVGTILGVNPFKSVYELFLEKTGQIEREDISDKLQVKLGHKMEQVVAELYEEETGNKVNNSLRTYRCKEYPFLSGHIDRKIVGQHKGLEIKTTSSFNRSDYKEGEVPPSHYYQCLFYMLITGWHDWDLATLRDNNGFYIVHVTWNEEEAEYMLEKIIEFWKCVENNEWTLLIDGLGNTSKAIEKRYPISKPNTVVDITSNCETFNISTYLQAKETMNDLKKIVDTAENNIKVCMGNNESAVIGNRYKVEWKTCKREDGYDTKKFLEEHPESDLKNYKKADSTYRRFSFKEIKAKEIHGGK